MKWPDFLGVGQQTWQQIRRFPTSDALADAVLIHALYGLVMAPFSFRKYLLRETWKEKWTWFSLPLGLVLTPFLLLWRFDLSLRLRRDEKKVWRTTTIYSSLMLLLVANGLVWRFVMRNEPREATERELEHLTETEKTKYREGWTRLQLQFEERPWQSPWTAKQIFWHLPPMAFLLNVLFRAFQPATRARFRKP